MGNQQRGSQVYYDPSNGQYYTMGFGNFPGTGSLGFSNFGKNYLNGFGQNQQKSPISDLVAQAMAAKANPVSMEQLFPSMNAPTMGNPMTNFSGLLGQATPFGQGQFGAGRFLSGNTMGNTGMTSNAMNTM